MDVHQPISLPPSLRLAQQKLQQLQHLSNRLPQQPQDLSSFSPDSLSSFSLDEYYNYAADSYNNIYNDFNDFYDYNGTHTDFSADSPLSLGSPASLSNLNAYTLASPDSLGPWAKLEASPDLDDFPLIKTESADDDDEYSAAVAAAASENCASNPVLFALPSAPLRDLSVSPAINPLQLSNSRSSPNTNVDSESSYLAADISPVMAPRDYRQAAVRKSAASASDSPATVPTSSSSATRASLKRKSSSSASSTGSAAAYSPRSPKSPRSPRSPHSPHSSRVSNLTSPTNGVASSSSLLPPPPKKTAHNLIEKRYRTNLNDKIVALRDSVPALRVAAHRSESAEAADNEDGHCQDDAADDMAGSTPVHKLNKATILSKATEYISQLEHRNQSLAAENASLRSKVDDFEMLLMNRGGPNGIWS